jgi:hypothetical protein
MIYLNIYDFLNCLEQQFNEYCRNQEYKDNESLVLNQERINFSPREV